MKAIWFVVIQTDENRFFDCLKGLDSDYSMSVCCLSVLALNYQFDIFPLGEVFPYLWLKLDKVSVQKYVKYHLILGFVRSLSWNIISWNLNSVVGHQINWSVYFFVLKLQLHQVKNLMTNFSVKDFLVTQRWRMVYSYLLWEGAEKICLW